MRAGSGVSRTIRLLSVRGGGWGAGGVGCWGVGATVEASARRYVTTSATPMFDYVIGHRTSDARQSR